MTIPLGEVVTFLDNLRKPVASGKRLSGPYPYYGANGLQGKINDFIFDEPLILLAEDGGHFGSKDKPIAYKISGKTWVNNHAHVLRPKEGIDINFLTRQLQYYDVSKYISGTTRKKLTKAQASKLPLHIPDYSEQKRIADILDKADSLRQKRKESIALLDELLKSVFIDMFGDPVRNEKGWEVRKAKDLFEIQLGKMLSAKNFTGKNLKPYLRNINVQWDAIDTTDIKTMDFDDREFKRYKLRCGDILVTEGGDVGRTAIYEGEVENCCYQNALHRLRKKVEIDSYYFLYFMMFAAERGMILKRTSTVTIAHFTAEKFKEFNVSYPDLELQEKFGNRVASAKKIKKAMNLSEKELDIQFNALLQRAFGGEGV